MADSVYVYIDGESHFIRSEHAWRKLHGEGTCLTRLRYVGEPSEGLILVDQKAKVFWTRRMNPGVTRAYYFTSTTGDAAAEHAIKVKLRDFDLEPAVIRELKTLASQRQNVLQTQAIIEKPKGVDISLAVRLLHDAYGNAFTACHLYTSDIDFLPVVEEVRGLGKRVFVHGYRDGLAQESPFLHACDRFCDLETMLRNECELDSPN